MLNQTKPVDWNLRTIRTRTRKKTIKVLVTTRPYYFDKESRATDGISLFAR